MADLQLDEPLKLSELAWGESGFGCGGLVGLRRRNSMRGKSSSALMRAALAAALAACGPLALGACATQDSYAGIGPAPGVSREREIRLHSNLSLDEIWRRLVEELERPGRSFSASTVGFIFGIDPADARPDPRPRSIIWEASESGPPRTLSFRYQEYSCSSPTRPPLGADLCPGGGTVTELTVLTDVGGPTVAWEIDVPRPAGCLYNDDLENRLVTAGWRVVPTSTSDPITRGHEMWDGLLGLNSQILVGPPSDTPHNCVWLLYIHRSKAR